LGGAHSLSAGQNCQGAETMADGPTPEQAQARLLQRVAAGDREAFAEFYDQTAAPLFSLAVRILGDAGEAEEALQDVFVQVWEKATMFDPLLGTAFHWALSITRHRAIDRLRRGQRRARLADELQDAVEADPPPASGPDQEALQADAGAAVRAALKSLPEDQRQAIEMAFFGGLAHPEIAEALRQPLGTIKARIRRGLLKLRDSLQDHA
jgi:RNA polymerase sigma-70 factor, ECF subfamily